MSISTPYISSSSVSSSVPFDNVAAPSFASTDVQAAIKEIREQPVFNSATQATTAAGTRTLTVTDLYTQFFTGSAAGYSIQLPNATLFPGNTPPNSAYFQLFNTTAQTIQVKDGSGANLFTLAQNSVAFIWLQSNPNAAGVWVYTQTSISTASGIITYNLTSSTTFSTTSITDVVITGFTLTPQAGTYGCWYNGASLLTTTPKTHWWSFYKSGSQIADSERSQDTAHSNQNMADSTMSIVQFNGTDTMDVRVRTQNGTLSIDQRSMLLIRLGT